MAVSPMKAVFVTRFFPLPAATGALQYSEYLIRLFGSITESLIVLCQPSLHAFIKGQGTASHVEAAASASFPKHVLFHVLPYERPSLLRKAVALMPATTAGHNTSANRSALLEYLDQGPDIVILDHLSSAWAVGALAAHRSARPRSKPPTIVYASHNSEYATRLSILKASGASHVSKLANWIESLRTRYAESKLLVSCDLLTCITKQDAMDLGRMSRKKHRNLVISPIYRGAVRTALGEPFHTRPRRICLVGSFLWSAKLQNLFSFLHAGYDLFRANRVEIHVVGVMRASDQHSVSIRWPGVVTTGQVEEIASHLDGCRIGVIAEDSGGGFKLKALDYAFQRVPMFALEHAVAGLELKHEQDAMLYGSMDALCRGIVAHVDNVQLLECLQANLYQSSARFLDEDASRLELKRALAISAD